MRVADDATEVDQARAELFAAAMAEGGAPIKLTEVRPGGWSFTRLPWGSEPLAWRATQVASSAYPGVAVCRACYLANGRRLHGDTHPCEADGLWVEDCGIER